MGSKSRSLSALFLSPSISLFEAITQRTLMSFKFKSFTTLPDDSRCSTFEEPTALNSEAPSISSLQPRDDLNSGKNVSAMPWFSNMSISGLSSQRKEVSRMIDQRIPVKNLNELKSGLVYYLASSGQVHDGLSVYNEIKQAGFNLKPKAIINLIGSFVEHLRIDGELTIMLQLLDELKDPRYWIDGCCRVLLYCILHKHLRSAIDLLRQCNNYFCEDNLGMRILYDEVFCFIAELDPTYIEIGLEILQVIKCEFGQSPPRTSLRFLLNACVNAKDLDKAQMIWKEYQLAGYSYDVISLLRMYQALLECGDLKSAKLLLRKIPKTNLYVQLVIKHSEAAYLKRNTKKKAATTQK